MHMPKFDELLQLAQSDPVQLETLRQQMVEKTINRAPTNIQHRLRGLQFQIDAQRQLANNSMSACIKISGMMHDHLLKLKQHIQPTEPHHTTNEAQEPCCDATVIPFPVAAR